MELATLASAGVAHVDGAAASVIMGEQGSGKGDDDGNISRDDTWVQPCQAGTSGGTSHELPPSWLEVEDDERLTLASHIRLPGLRVASQQGNRPSCPPQVSSSVRIRTGGCL